MSDLTANPNPEDPATDTLGTMTISAFARATGVPAETLRSWERRYGQPIPMRLPSGHRRYRPEDVERIRTIGDLVGGGMRLANLLHATPEALARAAPDPAPQDPRVAQWLDLAAEFKSETLRQELAKAMGAVPSATFMVQYIGPFMRRVGEAWERGEWTAGQEHCASGIVTQVLRELCATIRSTRAVDSSARVVVAGLPGESHGLALLMIEIISRNAGAETWNLGSNCPINAIAHAAAETSATHVLIHVSAANAGIPVDQCLKQLLDSMDTGTNRGSAEVIVGGAGALRNRRGVQGVTYLNELVELGRLLATWNGERTHSARSRPTRSMAESTESNGSAA